MSSLQLLIDQAAIRDLHLRYCRGVDRMDWALVRSCYHDDATDDHGSYSGGIDGFMDWVAQALAQFECTQHFAGNSLIEIAGDSAWAEHFAMVTHRRAAENEQPAVDLIVAVRYIDRVERRADQAVGAWRIARRVVIADFDRIDPVAPSWLSGRNRRAARDRSDPSYVR